MSGEREAEAARAIHLLQHPRLCSPVGAKMATTAEVEEDVGGDGGGRGGGGGEEEEEQDGQCPQEECGQEGKGALEGEHERV